MKDKTPIAAIILAAGKGTRMKSSLPKVMHPVAGRPMLMHVLQTAQTLHAEKIVTILSSGMPQAAKAVEGLSAVAIQDPQLGTGHAVRCAESALKDFSGIVLILYGDMPLITPETLSRMVEKLQGPRSPSMVVLGFIFPEQNAYGRLVMDNQGKLQSIVEVAEATPEQLDISLCNAGIMAVPSSLLFSWLAKLKNDNRKGEYYLTDIVALAREEHRTCGVVVTDYAECQGVNSREDLAEANMICQSRLRQKALDNGVTMFDPSTVYLCADTYIEADVTIHPHVVFGTGALIESGAEIRAFSHIEGAIIRKGAVVGPFARLRPGAVVGESAHVGNFVELKAATLGTGAKANHLAYIGDATVGDHANIGAGAITCNYDGAKKHKTVIGKGAFIGSNAALIAPVTVGDHAVIGAGSAIAQDVEPYALSLARAKQTHKPGWAKGKPKKK
jgi:bifunctional UDP-N-acetylglucosamine pyrophosphorylase/glucosamine-1-phosphate N-acetyltransferase